MTILPIITLFQKFLCLKELERNAKQLKLFFWMKIRLPNILKTEQDM